MLLQFRLSGDDEQRAYQALERSAAPNLNRLAKDVFLRHLEQGENYQTNLDSISRDIEGLRVNLQTLAKSQEEADPGLMLTVLSALFFLLYRSAPGALRTELDETFNADAVISFLKEGN